jgi:hypothetical protein
MHDLDLKAQATSKLATGLPVRAALFRGLLVPAVVALLAPVAILSGPLIEQRSPLSHGSMRDVGVPTRSGDGRVTAEVRLPTRSVIAGSTVEATVIVKNRSGSPLSVNGCGAPFAVAIESKAVPATVAWPACSRPMTIPTGTSKYRVAAVARYSSCSPDGPDRCIDLRPPPLPVGRYKATLYQNPQVLTTTPRSIEVRVTH